MTSETRLDRLHHWLGSIGLVVLTSAVIAFAIYVATSTHPSYKYLGPVCATNVANPGFDFWTGEPHGRIYTMYNCLNSPGDPHQIVATIAADVPDEMIGRRAIPLPDGFAIGLVVTLVVAAVVRRRETGNLLVSQSL